jgi:hypothetical protein
LTANCVLEGLEFEGEVGAEFLNLFAEFVEGIGVGVGGGRGQGSEAAARRELKRFRGWRWSW